MDINVRARGLFRNGRARSPTNRLLSYGTSTVGQLVHMEHFETRNPLGAVFLEGRARSFFEGGLRAAFPARLLSFASCGWKNCCDNCGMTNGRTEREKKSQPKERPGAIGKPRRGSIAATINIIVILLF